MGFEYKQFYRRKLPHRHSPGATLFVTFRLHNSIPRSVLEKWKQEKILHERELTRLRAGTSDHQEAIEYFQARFRRRWFGKFEDALHLEKGALWLKDPAVAKIVADALHFLNDPRIPCMPMHHGKSCALSIYALFKRSLTDRSKT
jgi:hypothetical protein